MNGKALFLIVFVFLFTGLRAQPYYFRHYQVENGLSNNTVGCSLQDQKGFLWFGTKDGLNRFDGYSFKVFQNDRDNPKSIGSNFIISLHEDKSGVLWVGTDRGLFKYDATTESFSHVKNAPADEIRGIQMDNNQCLWFIVKNQLFTFNLKTGEVERCKKLEFFGATSICMTEDGTLWIASGNGIIKKIPSNKKVISSYDMFDKSEAKESKRIQKLYDAGNGVLLIGTSNHGMKIFNTRTEQNRDVRLLSAEKTEVFVRDFVKYSEDQYWIASESGVFIYNVRSGQVLNLTKDYSNPYSISDNAVYTFCKDKEGGVWVGTYFGGINYYPKQYTGFKKYFPKYGGNSISGNAIGEITEDEEGNLWIGTEDAGLNRLNITSGIFTHFSPATTNRISHTNIHGLLIDGNELWVGTFHKGLDILDSKSGKLKQHYSASIHSLNSDFVCGLLKTRSGRIIVATDRGLCYFNAKEKRFNAMDELPRTFYTRVYEDRNGIIWAGTYSEGLYFFDPKTKKTGNFRYVPTDKSSLSGNRVNWICEDSKDQFWIATEGGLCRFEASKNSFLNYTVKDGLPSNIVYTLQEDASGCLWMSTSKGLVCFSPDSKKVVTYTKINGLLSDQFNYNSTYRDSSGRLYFGSVKGLISFHPAEFLKNTFMPPVYITGFQVYNKELEVNQEGSPLTKSIINTAKISLQYNESSFSIDFAALSFTAPEMTEYAYILEGLDKSWTLLKTNRKVFFTEVPPGTYTFKVKGSVGDGKWNGKPAILIIEISPPFWESNFAYVLYLIMIVSGIYFIVNSYHKRHEEKNRRKLELLEFEKEKEIYRAKIEFFTNVAHEIRTPLTLIKGPMEKVMKKVEEVPSIQNNLRIMERNTDRLINLTSQLLDFRKTEVNGFDLNLVEANIAEILKDNYGRFKTAAEDNNLSFEMHAPSELVAKVDVEALNKILSNILDNAIKYAESRVYVELLPCDTGEGTFTILFKNDGHIIPSEMREKIFETFFRLKETERQVGTGIGLSLSRSLAQLHQGTLELEEPQDGLNIFALRLPLSGNERSKKETARQAEEIRNRIN